MKIDTQKGWGGNKVDQTASNTPALKGGPAPSYSTHLCLAAVFKGGGKFSNSRPKRILNRFLRYQM